jgi:3-hydroxybutyrate dehydrogenase
MPASAALTPFDGRVALVTGASKGLGAAIARRLRAGGARLALVGRDGDALAAIARETDGLALQADVTDLPAVLRALERVREELGPISILVQNAGVASSAPLAATDDAMWEHTMAVNVTAPFRIARAVVPDMVRKKYGRVVHVASNAGLTGYAYTSAYCASKHALVGLTRALATEVAKSGVTVNAVCPGFLDTEMTDRAVAMIAKKTGKSREEARRALSDLSPQKRLVDIKEVAHVVAMLCEDEARGVNGQSIAIDGGQVMQ